MTSFIDVYNNAKYWEENKVRVRFPNEMFASPVYKFNWEEFKIDIILDDEVFGWWKKYYIGVNREDYNNSSDKK